MTKKKKPIKYKNKEKIVQLLSRLITKGTSKQFHLFFQQYHEADIADALEVLEPELRHQFFMKSSSQESTDVLEELELPQQLELITEFKTELAAKFIEDMEPDVAVDLLEELYEQDEEKADQILDAIPKEDAAEIKELLSYKEDSAGAIMTSEFVSIPQDLSVKEAVKEIKQQDPPNSEIAFYIFIVDHINRLVGYITLRDTLMAPKDALVKDIRNDYPIKTTVDTDQEEVAELFRKYDVIALPVVNHDNQLVGLITVDDVVDVVVEEATEDLYKLSGTGDVDELKLVSGKLIFAIQSRLPWLILTIFGGLVASYIITFYSDRFSEQYFSLALSLSFIPLLMGIGGNVGNQSATITVRSLATGVLDNKTPYKHILRELFIGLIIGGILALFLFLFTYLFNFPTIFSTIVSLTIIANITVATFLGASLPIIFKKLNIDPAVASAPFIATTLDIVGQIIYFCLTFYIVYLFL